MGAFSTYLEVALLNHLFRATALTAPTTLYVSLHTAAPDETGTPSNEVTGNAYDRVAVTCNTTNWGAPSTAAGHSQTLNSGAIAFPTPTPSGWGTVTHVGMYDAATNGNLMFSGALTASKVINAGDTVQFAASALVIQLD